MPTTIFQVGERFGFLTVVAELPKDARRHKRFLVRCDCGTEKSVQGNNLRSGSVVSCGCYRQRWRLSKGKPKSYFDPGEKVGFLTIVSEEPKSPRGLKRYLVCCDCGTEKSISGTDLADGNTVSCGCYRSRMGRSSEFNVTHADSRKGRLTAEYLCWASMKQRCLNSSAHNFKHYGGRGIKVCDRWLESYLNFIADMGRKPSAAHSIDRIDVNGNYEITNCRWATASEQNLNQRRSLANRE